MKITIESTTDAENQRGGKTIVLEDVESLGIVAVYEPGDKEREPYRQGIGNLGQVMRELPILNFVLTETMLMAGAAVRAQQAQQRIAVAQTSPRFNGTPDLRIG